MKRFSFFFVFVFTLILFNAMNEIVCAYEIEPQNASVRVRDVITLRPAYTTESSPKHSWISSDETIAKVQSAGGFSSGNVTGISPGVAEITALDDGIIVARYIVTVVDAPLPASITIQRSYIISESQEINIDFCITPTEATSLYEIECDNPEVIKCYTTGGNAGVSVSGVESGTSQITIYASNNIVLTATVYVVPEESEYRQITIGNGETFIPVYFDKNQGRITITNNVRTDYIIFVALYGNMGKLLEVRQVSLDGISMEIENADEVRVFALANNCIPLGESVTINNIT